MSSTFSQNLVSERFLSVRNFLGLSQKAFAEGLGISLRGEQNYERGERQIPSDVLYSLYQVYDVDPLWILAGKELQPRLVGNRNGLNNDFLHRAIEVVKNAEKKSGKEFSPEQFTSWIGAIYRFYIENPSGSGQAEVELIQSLLGGHQSV
ncbi:helix-turn-helix domain-containing protein [Thiomicrorhabdus sp. Milos-T2]|uniref:helix-turn-helix domain-containing protein n=1 Tax=Thiomicrorhabdus sp. Milos-T2 TaxID=90814 RepID=UPI00056DCA70|nr:helix-turn-helix transcriptional regulator [Thiomicrorhabdus sp. Milos-T2]